MTDLAPCPFCDGSTSQIVKSGKRWSVICGCDAEGPWAYNEDLAAFHWNRRAAPARADIFNASHAELADFIRDQVCCPRVWGCELGGAEECPAERVRAALNAAPASPSGENDPPREEQEIDWRDRALRAEAQRDRMREALEPFARLYDQIVADCGIDWIPDEAGCMRSALSYPTAKTPVRWEAFHRASLALLTEGGGDLSVSVASRGGSPAAPVKSETQEGH